MMENTELIKALRCCFDKGCFDGCPRLVLVEDAIECRELLMNAAADALEAAEQRIAELEKSYSWKAYAALEESIEGYKVRIAELEAQLSKEGEWIWEDSVCSPRTCSVCKQKFYIGRGWNYCPNCGCAMGGEKK